MVNKEYIIKAIEQEIQKTHDGTSSGPIRGHIANIVAERTESTFRSTTIISKDGKILKDYPELVTDNTHNEPYEEEWDEITDSVDGTDMHIITKISFDDMNGDSLRDDNLEAPWFHDTQDNEWRLLSESEADRMMETDKDGNYLVRSETIIGNDGTSITYTKNDSFNEANHEPFQNMVKEFNESVRTHEMTIHDDTYAMLKEYAQSQGYDSSIQLPHDEYMAKLKEFRQQAEDKYGSNIDFINNEWKPRFEEECNVKIKTQYNSNVQKKSIDDNDKFEHTWEQVYEEPFNGDWENWEGDDDYWPSLSEARRIYDDNMSSPYWGGDGT